MLFRENLRVKDYTKAARCLDNVGSGAMSVPGGGGDWTGPTKRTAVDAVKGVLRSSFEGPVTGDDIGRFGYASQLETILGNALVEQQLFDCKQGFFTLGLSRTFDEASFGKIARTLSAMANAGTGAVGYVAVGIVDNDEDAERVGAIDGVDPVLYRGFRVVGIAREAPLRGSSLNDYWHWLIQKVSSAGLDSSLARSVAASSRLISYHGLAVGLLKAEAGGTPSFFEGELYERSGSDTKLVAKADYVRVFRSFP